MAFCETSFRISFTGLGVRILEFFSVRLSSSPRRRRGVVPRLFYPSLVNIVFVYFVIVVVVIVVVAVAVAVIASTDDVAHLRAGCVCFGDADINFFKLQHPTCSPARLAWRPANGRLLGCRILKKQKPFDEGLPC